MTDRAVNEHEGLGRESAGTWTCSECGTTHMRFDPPLHWEQIPHGEACATVRPGTYVNHVPVCDLNKGHDGPHIAEMNYLERWPAVDASLEFRRG